MTRPAGPFVVRHIEVTRPADDTPHPDDWEALMPKLGDTLVAQANGNYAILKPRTETAVAAS